MPIMTMIMMRNNESDCDTSDSSKTNNLHVSYQTHHHLLPAHQHSVLTVPREEIRDVPEGALVTQNGHVLSPLQN